MFNQLRLAIAFLTLLPVAPKKTLSEKNISDSFAFFPLVALIFSTVSFLAVSIYFLIPNTWFLAIMIILGHSLLSGGLHLDAFMDSHDGLAVSDRPKEEITKVIKDSRAGAFAVIALFMVLSVQLIFVSQTNYQEYLYIYLLCFTPVFSRILLVIEVMFFINQEKIDNKSSLRIFFMANKFLVSFIALLVLSLAVLCYPLTKICIVVFFFIAFVFSFSLHRYLGYKLKGHNGDSVGCALVINESFMYFMIFLFSSIF